MVACGAHIITLLTNTAGKMARPGKSASILNWQRKKGPVKPFYNWGHLPTSPWKKLSWTRDYLVHLIIWHRLIIPVPLKFINLSTTNTVQRDCIFRMLECSQLAVLDFNAGICAIQAETRDRNKRYKLQFSKITQSWVVKKVKDAKEKTYIDNLMSEVFNIVVSNDPYVPQRKMYQRTMWKTFKRWLYKEYENKI